MADQLATVADLASYLQVTVDAAFTATATVLIECATTVVQECCGGQRIVQVVGDTLSVSGLTDSFLALPQIPVTAVSAVTLDGLALTLNTDYKLIGNRLWRRQGWQANYGWPWELEGIGSPWYNYAPPSLTWPFQEPSSITLTYTHGFAAGAQELQHARAAVLSLAKGCYVNPSGATSEAIDDYHVSYDAMAARMEAAPHLKASLAKKYGRRAALVRVG